VLAFASAVAATIPSWSDTAIPIVATAVPLNPIDPDQQRVGSLRYRGGIQLRSDVASFGGLSDLRIIGGGRRLVAVSDCGSALVAELRYDERGRLVDMVDARLHGLLAPGGRALRAGEEDAESLVAATSGELIVGFERRHRLWKYPASARPLEHAPVSVPAPPDSARLPPNQGFEAAVGLGDGRVLLVAEADRSRHAPAWLSNGSTWESFLLPLAYTRDVPDQPFRPTAMATLSNGDVLVLERRFPPLAARLRRLARAALDEREDLAGTEVAVIELPLSVDNFEGLEVAPGPDGAERLYLLSDDNDCEKGQHRHGTSLQRTLLLSFSLEP
jgi:hypothetical protein